MPEPLSAKVPPGHKLGEEQENKREIGLGWLQPSKRSVKDPMRWIEAAGNVAGLFGTGLDWEREQLQKSLGGGAAPGLKGALSTAFGPVSGSIAPLLQRQDVQDIYKTQGAAAAWRYLSDKVLPPVAGGLVETAVDPLSLIGFGAPGMVAQGTKLAPVAKVAGVAQKAETALTDALSLPLKGIGAAAKNTPGVKKLFEPSTRGQLAGFVDELTDAINEATGLGYKYKGLEFRDPQLGQWPGAQGAANKVENDAWKGLEDRISAIKEPLARFRAFVAKEYANINAGQWGTDAAGEAAQATAEGNAKEAIEVWQTRHRKVMQLVKSLQDTIGKFGAEEPITSTPEQAQVAQKLTDDMVKSVRQLTFEARDRINALKDELGPMSNAYRAEADKLYRARNEAIRNIIKTSEQQMEEIYYPGARARGETTFPETGVQRDLQGRLSELQSLAEGLPSFFGKMSDERAGTLKGLLPSFERYAKFVDRDRNRVAKVLGDVQSRNPGLSVEDVEDSAHLLERIKTAAQPYEHNELRNILERWTKEGKDLLKDDELDLVTHRIAMDKRNQLGIKNASPWLSPIQTGMSAWKEMQLLSPRFHEQNALGQLFMGGISGVNPARVARAQTENVGRLIRRQEVQPPTEVAAAMRDWEQVDVPHTIQQTLNAHLTDQSIVPGANQSETAVGKIPTLARVGAGALLGAPAGPVGAAFGAGMGYWAPTLASANRKLGNALEYAARSTGWLTGKDEHVRVELPRFVDWLASEMRKTKPKIGGVSAKAYKREPKSAEEFEALLDEYKSMVEGNPDLEQALAEAATELAGLKEKSGIIRPTNKLRFIGDADLMELAKREGLNVFEPDWWTTLDDVIVKDFLEGGRSPSKAVRVGEAKAKVTNLEGEQGKVQERWREIKARLEAELKTAGVVHPVENPVTEWRASYTVSQINRIKSQLNATQGRMGPQRLVKMLTENGVDIDITNTAAQKWQNVLQQGDAAGEKLATKFNFDYTKTDNLDEFLRYVVPFAVWPRRAIPFFLQAMAEHPGFLVAMDRYNKVSEEDTEGLPARFKNAVSAGNLGERIASIIFRGKPGKLMTSPVEMLMPFAGMQPARPGDEPGEQMRRLIGDVGFGIGPWIDIPLTMAGAYGDRPMPRLLRHSGLLESVTGTDVEAPIKRVLGDDSNWVDYLVNNRLKEMSVEDTGKPGVYEKSLSNPADPVYQRAARQAQIEKAAMVWLNFLQPMYTRTLRETEEVARKERAKLPKFPRDEFGNIVIDNKIAADQEAWKQFVASKQAHPLSETYGKATPPISATELLSRVRGFATLRSPAEKSKWYSIIDKDRLGRQYLAWAKEQGHNVDKGDVGSLEDVKRFIAERGG